jgi:excinuclease ABC subunit C
MYPSCPPSRASTGSVTSATGPSTSDAQRISAGGFRRTGAVCATDGICAGWFRTSPEWMRLVCASEHEAAWLERNLLEHRKPRWNRSRGGQELPVCLRLTERSTSAALSIVHEGMADADGRMFGPYLGGGKVRLAVSALHRVLPVAYAGDRLTGSERDMARALGVSHAGRAELVGAVTAVLDRDPNAVAAARDRLVSRRDDAAAGLLFELAARIQAEIDAVEWLVAPQRATSPEPARADVYGWADGILVGFQVREGRLREWTQRYCDESTATALVAGTPAPWQDFAQRNAELAARLTRAPAQATANGGSTGEGHVLAPTTSETLPSV